MRQAEGAVEFRGIDADWAQAKTTFRKNLMRQAVGAVEFRGIDADWAQAKSTFR